MTNYLATKAVTGLVVGLAALGLAACNDAQANNTSPADTVTVPRCLEDEVVSKTLTCTHPDVAEFRHGYWIAP